MFRLVLAEHDLVTGEVVLVELERVLSKKFKMPPDRIREVTEPLRDAEVQPRPDSIGSLAVRDPDDAWVLASAIAARADVLVTGDPDLLVLSSTISPPVITNPRGFWDLHRHG